MNTRLLAVFAVILIASSAFAGIVAFSDDESDAAVPAGYIPVTSPADLARVGTGATYGGYTWSLDAKYFMTQNIVLSGTNNHNPIGTVDAPFTGTFDGNGCVIENMHISKNDSVTAYAGLFAVVKAATILNLGLENCYVSITSSEGTKTKSVAGIAGHSYAPFQYPAPPTPITTITNSYVTGTISVTNTAATGSVHAYAAGIAGQGLYSSFKLDGCYNAASVSATNSANISGYNAFAAGITAGATVTDCYNTGAVSARSTGTSSATISQAGGIVSIGGTVTNCYSTGTASAMVSGSATPRIGGIAGSGATVVNCYYLAGQLRVNGSTVTDAIMGVTSANIDGTSVPERLSNQVSGARIKTEMQPTQVVAAAGSSMYYTGVTKGNVSGWDFDNVWIMKGAYPELRALEDPFVLEITSARPDASLVVGDTFGYTVETNAPSGVTLSVSGASWLSVVGDRIVGTPVNSGTFTVTVTAVHGNDVVTQTFVLSVTAKLVFESKPTGSILVVPA